MLKLYLAVATFVSKSSADSIYKQFVSRSGPTKQWADLDTNCLIDSLIGFLKEFSEVLILDKKEF